MTTAIIAVSMILGYVGSHVGIPPLAAFAIVSFAALLGEYVRRLTLYYYHRQDEGETRP
ncbi:MAG: hypothetical protein OXI35_00140 [Gemmatimonadota bacterium]|nr:hypothetical protein [Gemmatimonadota bacterium]